MTLDLSDLGIKPLIKIKYFGGTELNFIGSESACKRVSGLMTEWYRVDFVPGRPDYCVAEGIKEEHCKTVALRVADELRGKYEVVVSGFDES